MEALLDVFVGPVDQFGAAEGVGELSDAEHVVRVESPQHVVGAGIANFV